MTTLFGLDNCDTCRKARNWLTRSGIAHAFVDYRAQPQAPATLVEWKEQVGGWDLLVNKSSTTWRNLSPHRKAPGSDAEWKLLLREYPQLIRRPVPSARDSATTPSSSASARARLGTRIAHERSAQPREGIDPARIDHAG